MAGPATPATPPGSIRAGDAPLRRAACTCYLATPPLDGGGHLAGNFRQRGREPVELGRGGGGRVVAGDQVLARPREAMEVLQRAPSQGKLCPQCQPGSSREVVV